MRRFVVPIAVVVVAVAAATTAFVFVRRHVSGPGGLPSLVLKGSTTCRMSQLSISYYGERGVPGTAITGFEVTDTSILPCTLSGAPIVSYFSGAPKAREVLRLSTGHSGVGIAFSTTPATVVLEPRSSTSSAAFIVTSAEFQAGGSAQCPQVTAIQVSLYRPGSRTTVPLWYPASACSPPHVEVSVFFPAKRLASYVNASLPPTCAAADLAIHAGRASRGLGHAGSPIVFRNTSDIPCRMRGYPSVIAFRSDGAHAAAQPTPAGYLGGLASGSTSPPLVTLNPGGYASAYLEGLDFVPPAAAESCPSILAISVSAPDEHQLVRLPMKAPLCSEIEIHPIVGGTSGRAEAR